MKVRRFSRNKEHTIEGKEECLVVFITSISYVSTPEREVTNKRLGAGSLPTKNNNYFALEEFVQREIYR